MQRLRPTPHVAARAQYVQGDAPGFDRSDWLNEKETLGLDFPNLPYMIDGDLRITQSHAILTYLARKHDLGAPRRSVQPRAHTHRRRCITDGDTVEQKAVLEMLSGTLSDMQQMMVRLFYNRAEFVRALRARSAPWRARSAPARPHAVLQAKGAADLVSTVRSQFIGRLNTYLKGKNWLGGDKVRNVARTPAPAAPAGWAASWSAC